MTSLKSFGNKVAGPSNLVERLSDCAGFFRSAANSNSGKKQTRSKNPKIQPNRRVSVFSLKLRRDRRRLKQLLRRNCRARRQITVLNFIFEKSR